MATHKRKMHVSDATLVTTTGLPLYPLVPDAKALMATLGEVQAAITAILAKVPTAVTTNEDYTTADACLGEIQSALKVAEGALEPYIRPFYVYLEGMYELRRSLQQPLSAGEMVVKRLMGDWKVAEARRIREEEEARAKAVEAERRRALAAAPLPTAIVDSVGFPIAGLPIAVATAVLPSAFPVAVPFKAPNSSSTIVKKWRITDLSMVIDCCQAGLIPQEVEGNRLLVLNEFAVNCAMKGDGWKAVAEWPGLDVYDDARITGR